MPQPLLYTFQCTTFIHARQVFFPLSLVLKDVRLS